MKLYLIIFLLLIIIILFYKTKKIEHFNKILNIPCLKNKEINKVKFITITNDGYIDYTINCLKSLELINFKKDLYCYSIGNKAHKILLSKGYKSELIEVEENNNQFYTFRKGNWHHVTKKKFDIIYKNLLVNKYVCITDGDIVFLNNNFMNYCLNNIHNNDIMIQNDTLSDFNNSNLCSGFMFIKSNKLTLDIFKPENVKKYIAEGWGDQSYINKFKNKLKFKKLPLNLFPNGKYYYNTTDNNNILYYFNLVKPYMVHFNWVNGHEKQRKMRKHNMWYINTLQQFKNISLKNWQKKYKPIDDIIIQNSPTDGSSSWGNIFIGMSYLYNKFSDEEKDNFQIGKHNKLLLCAISDHTDQRRRGESKINRKIIIKNLENNKFENKKINPNYYFKNLSDYKFVISPEGNGIDCHRHYEALLSGCIPICEFNEKIKEKYKNLPILYTKDYSEITENYLESKYNEFLEKEYDFSRLFLSHYTKNEQNIIKKKCNYWLKKRKLI